MTLSMWDMPREGNSDRIPVPRCGMMSGTQSGTLYGSERGHRCAVSGGEGGDPCWTSPASAADRQREDRQHGVRNEKCLLGTEMVSGSKLE